MASRIIKKKKKERKEQLSPRLANLTFQVPLMSLIVSFVHQVIKHKLMAVRGVKTGDHHIPFRLILKQYISMFSKDF